MESENFKIRLTRTGEKENTFFPQFSLAYKPADQIHEILSRLKEDQDLVIELNSSMGFGSDSENEKTAELFLQKIQELGLDFTHRTLSAPARGSVFTQLFTRGSKSIECHEILAYIPGSAWSQQGIKELLPVFTARYYLLKSYEESKELLDGIARMTDQEKLEHFRLTLFVAPKICQIGIISRDTSEPEIRRMLGI